MDFQRNQPVAAASTSLLMPPGMTIVSFVFEGFPASALHEGGSILERHGARGTYYRSVAPPHATTEADADEALRRGHELRARDGTTGHWRPGINKGTVDTAALKAYPLCGTDDIYRSALACIHEVKDGGWLVFHTQDVAEHPSRYGARTVVFEYIVATVAEAGLAIMTIDAALQSLGRR